MKSKSVFIKTALVVALSLILVFSAFLVVSAVFNEEEAVHINPSEIEDSTLVVGTHLIHLSALDDTIYEVAQKSAEESGQNNVYYKSELADGAWFDITTASSLEDITSGGTPVADSVIAELFLTHHTKSDGVTYDLRTGQPVDPRDIYSPYDLESLDELYPLKLQYDTLREAQSGTEEGQRKVARIASFFQTETRTENTDSIELQMASLQTYYDALNNNDGGTSEKSKVQEVLDALDASRRAEVFTILESELGKLLEELTVQTSTESGDSENSEDEAAADPGFGSDTELQSAVSDSLNNVRSSLIEQQGKMLAEGTTTASRTEYELSTKLIQDAQANNHSACDNDVSQLISLDNIMNDVIADQNAELALLDDSLITSATNVYTTALSSGINAEYTAAQSQNSAQVVLDSIAKNNTSLLNSYRNELEFFLTAKTDRMDPQEGMTYLDERLTLTESWVSLVPNDAFLDGARSSISDHIEFLTNLRRQLELAAGGNNLDSLIAQKADLQTQMMSCLDNNDLAGAKDLENQIAEIDAQLDGANIEGTLGSQVAKAKSDGLSALESGDADALMDSINSLNSLMELDPKTAVPAAQDLHNAIATEKNVNGNNAFDDALSALESSILNNADAYQNAVSAQLTADALQSLFDQFLSGLSDQGLSDSEIYGVLLMALQYFYDQTGNQAALSLISSTSLNQYSLGNPLVYLRINDSGQEYLPLTSVSFLTDMRYVWNKNLSTATLAKGANYYGFSLYSDAVIRGKDGETTEYMIQAAKSRGDAMHVHEDYTLEQFDVGAVYLSHTQYGVAYDSEMEQLAQELLVLFLSA